MTYTPSLEIRSYFSADVINAVEICEALRAAPVFSDSDPSEIVDFVHEITGLHFTEIWDCWGHVNAERLDA